MAIQLVHLHLITTRCTKCNVLWDTLHYRSYHRDAKECAYKNQVSRLLGNPNTGKGIFGSSCIACFVTLRFFSRENAIKKLNAAYERKYKNSNDRRYAKNNVNVAMHLQVLPQIISLLWQLINHKHIVNILELQIWYTIIIGNFNYEESIILYWMTLVCVVANLKNSFFQD